MTESEEKFRKISDAANDAIITADYEGNITYWNKAAEKMFDYSTEGIIGRQLHTTIIPDRFREAHLNGFKKFCDTGQGTVIGKTIELAAIRKDGTEFPIELSLSGVKIRDKWCAVGIIRDITERKQAEESIRKLSRAVEHSPSTIVITDADGKIEYVNPKFSELTGYSSEEAIGKNPNILKSDRQSTEFYKDLWETITSGKEWRGEFSNKKKDGELYWEFASISPVRDEENVITHYIAVKEDITDRKRMEEELRVSQKMSSIGRLTGSVFHEILNPVNIIASHTQLLLMEAEKGSKTEEDLKSIQDEIDRIVQISNGLMKFSRKNENLLEEIEINDLLENTLSLIIPEMNKESIKVITELEENPLEVMAQDNELSQVFLSMITNAIDAMPEGGTLTVMTKRVLSSELGVESNKVYATKLRTPNSRLKEDFVEISFTDTGCGIAENNIDKVFEPFFSTKKEIKGVGLGLSTAYAIIEGYGGKLSVESEEGKGAMFTIELPIRD